MPFGWKQRNAELRALRAKRLGQVALGAVVLVSSAAIGIGAGNLANGNAVFASEVRLSTSDLREAISLRLPKTEIGDIDCALVPDLCEITAGSNLFYTDHGGRYLVIGRVYDMETRQDLTAARLLALNPDMLLNANRTGGASGTGENSGASSAGAIANTDDRRLAAAPAAKVDLSALSEKGVVHWGAKRGLKAVVLSDFACGYCQRLASELEAIGVRVEERPISIFGATSRKTAEAVLCADDPAKALAAAYAGRSLPPVPADCDTTGLDENEAFAKANGFSGTPVVIAADGRVLTGYRPASQLKAFLEGDAK